MTDEDFRREFRADPHGTLQRACDWGLCLSDFEMRALVATDCTLWDRIAEEVDGRLQKASLKNV